MICPSNESSLVSTASDSHINCAKTRGGEIRVSNRVVCWKTKKNVNFEFFFSSSDFISLLFDRSRAHFFLGRQSPVRQSDDCRQSHTQVVMREGPQKREKNGQQQIYWYRVEWWRIIISVKLSAEFNTTFKFFEKIIHVVSTRDEVEWTQKKNNFFVFRKKLNNTIHWPIWSAWRVGFLSSISFVPHSNCCCLLWWKKKRVSISTFCHLMNTSNKHFSPE